MSNRVPHSDKASNQLRQQLFSILHQPSPDTRFARPVNYFLAALILCNCIAVSLETVASVYKPNSTLFFWLEIVSMIIFSAEYLLRIWVCVEQPRYAHALHGRLRYALQPLPILDLVVILTFFAPIDLRFLRIFRVTRLLRVMHLEVFDQSMQAILHAVMRRKHLLFVSVTVMLTAIYCTAALIYSVEHTAQPDKFGSIPETMWWAVVTLTTIGYGDIAPITPLGKLLTSAIVIFGIGVFALPTAILTAAILDSSQRASTHCPHCNQKII